MLINAIDPFLNLLYWPSCQLRIIYYDAVLKAHLKVIPKTLGRLDKREYDIMKIS